jgi:uncharacterized protein with von Willebrand factor type A (vWA) domain
MRRTDAIPTHDVLHKYDHTWKLIFVGDASMSPYELSQAGGAATFWNAESGQVWLQRLISAYPKAVWLNPTGEKYWHHTHTIGSIRKLMDERMFGLTLAGLDTAMRRLMH